MAPLYEKVVDYGHKQVPLRPTLPIQEQWGEGFIGWFNLSIVMRCKCSIKTRIFVREVEVID